MDGVNMGGQPRWRQLNPDVYHRATSCTRPSVSIVAYRPDARRQALHEWHDNTQAETAGCQRA
jgi:hypothetical protein